LPVRFFFRVQLGCHRSAKHLRNFVTRTPFLGPPAPPFHLHLLVDTTLHRRKTPAAQCFLPGPSKGVTATFSNSEFAVGLCHLPGVFGPKNSIFPPHGKIFSLFVEISPTQHPDLRCSALIELSTLLFFLSCRRNRAGIPSGVRALRKATFCSVYSRGFSWSTFFRITASSSFIF